MVLYVVVGVPRSLFSADSFTCSLFSVCTTFGDRIWDLDSQNGGLLSFGHELS